MEEYADIADVLRATGKSEPIVRRWMSDGRFPRPTHKKGKRLYWLRSEVEEAAKRLLLPQPIAAPQPTPDAPKPQRRKRADAIDYYPD